LDIGWLSYPHNAFVALCGIYVVLIIATLYVALSHLADRTRDLRELWLRVRTWWFIITTIAIALGSAKQWPAAPFVLFGFISFIALKEFLSIVPTRCVDRPVFWIAYLSIPMQYLWAASLEDHGLFQMSLFVYVCPLIVVAMLFNQRTEGFLNALGTMGCGLLIAVYSPSHLAHFFALPAGANPSGGVMGFVLALIILSQGNDVAQYVWGKLLGRRKIIPLVSPNKTWEGFVGGVVTTMLVSAILVPYLTPFSALGAALIGMLVSVTGFFGDVFVSAIKRDVGVKDASMFLPGHGGMLDRIDSLTITAPLYFHIVYYFVYMKGGWVCSTTSCG
jgi:phosphatidate cytidylyltransferase